MTETTSRTLSVQSLDIVDLCLFTMLYLLRVLKASVPVYGLSILAKVTSGFCRGGFDFSRLQKEHFFFIRSLMDSKSVNLEERLKSFLIQLQNEFRILDSIVYKGKNQHRRCFYFQG
ncbi:hypothetical protein MKX03_025357 [Papaver bracteatum]|nr:hypothetical protein MKX03_025357 [Papaver bracteatum]